MVAFIVLEVSFHEISYHGKELLSTTFLKGDVYFMDEIRKYINNFRKDHVENSRFSMRISEFISATKEAKGEKVAEVISVIFSYGYAKGYRACQAKLKKDGVLV